MAPPAEHRWPGAVAWAERTCGPVTDVRELVGGTTSTVLALTPRTGPPVVLRLVDREPWRTHGPGLVTREAEVQRMLAPGPVPAPRSLALDAEGTWCGHPAHLMSLLPGVVDPDRTDPTSLARLADTLAAVHAVRPTVAVRAYESWAFEEKYVVPARAGDPELWRAAFALLRGDPPAVDPVFLHRDFQPSNVLWSGDRVSGLVDWVETSIGPAWLDVAHCATNLAVRHGGPTADAFAAAYTARTGRRPQPFFDVMDVVGFLPPPGRAPVFPDPADQRRLEARLATVLPRALAG